MDILPPGKTLVLASKSPRRQELLQKMGISFTVRTQSIPENYPGHLQGVAIAEYLAGKKAESLFPTLGKNEIVLTSDTVVWCDHQSLEKATGPEEAYRMLSTLSGKTHEVITAVCLRSRDKKEVFSDTVQVQFRTLTDADMRFYIEKYQPFDKAGAYGIQEWIGMIGITAIQGSFFTVMGLPTHLLYERLPGF